MHRLLFPLCLVGLVLAAGVSRGFIGTIAGWRDAAEVFTSSVPMQSSSSSMGERIGPIFTDVDPQAWYKPFVDEAAMNGIIVGYTDKDGHLNGYFGPLDKVKLVDAILMVMRTIGDDRQDCGPPGKVGGLGNDYAEWDGHPEHRALGCALQHYADFFYPKPDLEHPILRAEFLGLLHDLFHMERTEERSGFRDTVGHTYEYDVALAVKHGIVAKSTKAHDSFRPDDLLTRAEAAKFLIEARRIYGALSSSSSMAGNGSTIDMTVSNFAFAPTAMSVTQGEEVAIRFTVSGTHTFVIPELGVDKTLQGPTDTLTFTPKHAGSFRFYCAMSGHDTSGMVGTIEVKAKE